MSLSDTACKNAHKNEKASLGKLYKLTDEKGLYLIVKLQTRGWGVGDLNIDSRERNILFRLGFNGVC